MLLLKLVVILAQCRYTKTARTKSILI